MTSKKINKSDSATPVEGRIWLEGYSKGRKLVEKLEFESIKQAAWHIQNLRYRARHVGYLYGAVDNNGEGELTYELRNSAGKQLNLDEILAWFNRQRQAQWSGLRRGGPYEYRRGPVGGTRCSRGGGGFMRHMRTTAERRLNALVLKDEGEVPARVARTGHNLPNSWDDYRRHQERCWKAQHKGRKSWDRH